MDGNASLCHDEKKLEADSNSLIHSPFHYILSFFLCSFHHLRPVDGRRDLGDDCR